MVTVVMVVSGLPFGSTSARAANAPTPWTVTVAPTLGITDGATVSITVETDGAHPVYAAKAQVCRSGVDYQSQIGFLPHEDFAIGGPNCPSVPISTSADLTVTDSSMYEHADQPGGETFTMLVGVGTVAWVDPGGVSQSLTCDAMNPCDLVVEVRGQDADGTVRWVPFVQSLAYKIDDPIAGCGGPASGIVSTGSSDRMSEAWIDWTLEQCHLPDAQHGAATGASFAGEGSAMDGFSRGELDMVYSAVGYDADVGLGTGSASEALTARPSVVVPVGLNAVVLAVGNGRPGPGGKKIPYDDISLTLDEATALIAGGPTQMNDWLPGIYAENPELAATGMFDSYSSIQLGALADAESSSWFATHMFKTLRPSLWKVPNTNTFGAEAGLARGEDASLALADPSFQNVISLYTGRTILDKTIKNQSSDAYGGIWALTDLVTARQLGMTVVKIQNAAGASVEPTPESMNAALASMHETGDGRLMPDPDTVAGTDGVEPYPLTFVEYALLPTKPLIDIACNPRPASQDLLTTWLHYVIDGGQQSLPAGMEPITPAMVTMAEAAIDKMGKVPNTCTPVPPTSSPSGSSPLGAPEAAPVIGATRGAASSAIVPPAGSTVAVDAQLASANAALPEFAGRSAGANVVALLGLLVVLGVLSLSVMVTSGRLPLPRLRRPGRPG